MAEIDKMIKNKTNINENFDFENLKNTKNGKVDKTVGKKYWKIVRGWNTHKPTYYHEIYKRNGINKDLNRFDIPKHF